MISIQKIGLITCILSFLCMDSFAANTQVYTWTDKDGVVHYSETPPKDKDQPSALVTTKTQPGLPLVGEPSDKKTESAEDPKTLPSKDLVEQVLKKDPEACKQATDALNSLMSRPIIRRDGKVMTIEEKNQEVQNMKDIMKVHC